MALYSVACTLYYPWLGYFFIHSWLGLCSSTKVSLFLYRGHSFSPALLDNRGSDVDVVRTSFKTYKRPLP